MKNAIWNLSRKRGKIGAIISIPLPEEQALSELLEGPASTRAGEPDTLN